MSAVIIGLHLVGWGTLICLVEPAHFSVGGKAFGIGIGLTAYTLGLRHAFDADHIAAIDNTTRKLMNDGQRPLAVGFFFSLGHSTVAHVSSRHPVRTRVRHRVVVALLIGTVELLGLLADRLGWSGGFWDRIAALDVNAIGFVIVAMFVATWAIALLVWRYGRIEEKWAVPEDSP